MMINPFYFTLKALFVLKYLIFYLGFFGHVERKRRLILKFMTSQPGKQTIAIHIQHYISRSKDNQTVKLGQLIEYNMRKIFLEKSYAKCGGETSPKTFSKK